MVTKTNKGDTPTQLAITKVEAAERREANAPVIAALPLPEIRIEALSNARLGTQSKFLSELNMLQDPTATLLPFIQTALTRKDEDDRPVLKVSGRVTKGFARWASSFDVSVKEAETGESAYDINLWLNLGREIVRKDIERLLINAGAEVFKAKPHVYTLMGTVVDTVRLTVDKKPVKPGILFLAGGSRIRTLTAIETMYFILSGAISGTQRSSKNAKKVFSGYIALAYGKTTDGEHLYNQDPGTQAYFQSKTPTLILDFGPNGFSINPMDDEKQAADVYQTVTQAATFLAAHYQGKYFYDMRSGALPMDIDLAEGMVYLASNSIAKAWKRHNIGLPLAMSLENPDVGYFSTSNGELHYGRRIPVFVKKNGLNYPYLGMVCSTLNNRELAELFKVVEEDIHEFQWAGDLRNNVTLPEEGSKVTVGQMLVNGAPESTPARQTGYVYYLDPFTYENGMTSVKMIVSAKDRTGEFKLRSWVLKGQPYAVGFINPDWQHVLSLFGYNNLTAVNGDYAIIDGLKDGDPVPVLTYSTDGAKINGDSSTSAGVVALEAETTETRTVYSGKSHFEGAYDDRIEKFRKDNTRILRDAMALTEDLFHLMLNEVSRPDVTLHAVTDLSTKKSYYIAVQETEALLAYDLVKVEYTPVKDSVTMSRFPLETAVLARVCGLNSYAEEILDGGADAFAAVKAVNNAVVNADKDGVLRLADGRSLSDAGISVINVNANHSAKMVSRLREVAMDPRLLKLPLCFVNEEVLTSKDGLVQRKLYDWVLIDPAFLAPLGGSKQTAQTIASFFSQLCTAIADNSSLKQELIPRLAGKVKALANSQKTAKRTNRGSQVVVSKTVAGMVPNGWAAVSYHGVVAKLMARAAGFLKPSSKRTVPATGLLSKIAKKVHLGPNTARKQFVKGLASLMVPDVYRFAMSGPVGSITRSPQQAPLPIRFYFPDAPQAVWDKMVLNFEVTGNQVSLNRLVPEGVSRCATRLEPNRTCMSPRDSAYCHGDHDGDLRQNHVATRQSSKEELLAFHVETHRLRTLKLLQKDVVDPVVEAFKLDPKKSTIAVKAVRKTLAEFHAQNRKTIYHQTVVVGQAYNLAHFALTRADRKPSALNAAAAHAMWVGPYEENLGGADNTQLALFALLEKNPYTTEDSKPDYDKYEARVRELAAEVNWSGATADMLLTLNKEIKAVAAVEYGWESAPLGGMELIRALQAGVYRRISAGCMVDGKLDELIIKVYTAGVKLPTGETASVRETIRSFANAGSISARVITRFYDEVYPLIVNRLAAEPKTGDDYGY